MARHNALEIPLINPRHALIERGAIPRTRTVPNNPFLPRRRARRALRRKRNLRQDPGPRVHARLAELLCRGEVEHHVRGDERLGGAVVEHEFLVQVRGDVFPVELCVEFWGDCGDGLGLLEEEGEGHVLVALLLALLGEGLGAQDGRVGVGLVPGAEEDVVLWVR
jgi:hypothetical protein